jgi:hypothetical protein
MSLVPNWTTMGRTCTRRLTLNWLRVLQIGLNYCGV